MKVLLTGATGFIGTHVLDQLLQKRVDVVVLGRSRPENFDGKFVHVDLISDSNLSQIVKEVHATHLLHLAWYAEHGKYWTSNLNLAWLNASVRLAEGFCAGGGHQIVMSGTCAEYDWQNGYHLENELALLPKTLYGVAKDATRRLTAIICADNEVNFAWGRIFIPFGLGEDRRRLIPSLFDVFLGYRPAFGVNGTAYRDFLPVDDVATGLVHLLLEGAHGSFNISSGMPIQIAELVETIATMAGGNPQQVLSLCSERPGEPPLLVGDNAHLKAAGWKASHNMKSALLSYFSKYRSMFRALPSPI
jgi:nucleoside-diphosphate-sugar epimerase